MYHPEVVEARIRRAIERKAIDFQPEYHSVVEADSFVRHLEDLRDPETGELKRMLDPAEIAWIRNETFLCRVDYGYWESRYVSVINEEGRVVRFKPRIAQQIIGDMMAENERNEVGILFQVLKARQLGLSREIENRVTHRVIFYANVNAVVASSDEGKSAKLAGMMEFVLFGGKASVVGAHAYGGLPWWMLPAWTARREGEYIEFGRQNSAITISHGRQFNGIARGDTPTVCHLSELCEFVDAEGLVDASLLRAMHDSPWLFLVLESTALGRGNWWHKTWLASKEGWPQGRSRLRPVFLPWFVGTDLYPTEAWLRARPVPPNYVPKDYVVKHARRAKEYVESNDLLSKYLGADWEMPLQQMWFYEVERDEATRKGQLNKFLSEMPASDDEAFQSTNISVFDSETISAYRDLTRRPIAVYGITGPEEEVPRRLQPARPQIDFNRPSVMVKATWGTSSHEYTLVPLKWNGYSTDDGLGKIYIWEEPEPNEIYGFGVDTSDGIGKDRSTIEGLRKGSLYRRPAQVLEYANSYVNAHDLVPICMAVGSYYATRRDGHLQQPRMAIECKGNGDTTQFEMRKRGWSNFHPWQRIDSRKISREYVHKLGIYTNQWFRAQMMDWLIKFLRDGEVEINSPFFVGEMESLEGDELVQSLKAGYGEHDDRIMALGFIIVSLYQMELRQGVTDPSELHRKDDFTVHPRYNPGYQALPGAFER